MDERAGDRDRDGRTAGETLDGFEDARAPYVPPGYEVTDAPGPGAGDPASPGRREREGGADASEGVLNVLDREDAAVVLVDGESGIGKSRLLAEVGRAIRDRDPGRTVRYVRPPCADPPPIDGDTVLLLDDAERLDHPGRVLRLPAEADGTVQVVAAVRQVHRRSLDAGVVPDAVPRYDLTIHPLDDGRTVDLLADRDVPEERAREIHEAAGGNPTLARHLARSGTEATAAGVVDALDDAIETAVAEADLPADAATARRLLRAVAVLGTYDPGATGGDADGLPLDPDDRRRVLDGLRDAGLLDAVEGASGTEQEGEGADGPTFALHESVLAEYCRYRAVEDGTGRYADLLDARLATDAPGIARGLVDLRRSPLVRVGALDGSEVAEHTRPRLEDVAGGVVDADAPLADALRVGALVNLVAPDAVPHAELAARCEDATPDAAGAMYRLAAGTYRHASATATDEYDLSVPPATLFAHARTWLDRLNGLAIDRPDDAALQHRLARALRDAAASERAAGNFDGAGTCLDRLDVLAEDNGEVAAVQAVLATALRDAIGAAGEAGRVDDIGARLDRLSGIADAHPDHDGIRRALAVALVNATGYEDAAGVDTLAARLDRLSALADAHPEDEDLQHRLAGALLNVTSVEASAGRFEALDAHLDRLAALADAHPGSDEIRHRYAQALLSAVDHEATAGRFDDLTAHLDALAALAAEHPDHDDVQRRLAQALLTVVNHESEAGRFDALADRLDRLSTLATDNPDNGAVQVPTMGSYFIALRHLAEAGRFDAVAAAVEDLGGLARRPDGLTVGSKGKEVTELAAETGEHLLRAGRLDLFEAFAGVLADGLSGGRWRSISSDLFMTADTLVGEGILSMEEYARVVECCGE